MQYAKLNGTLVFIIIDNHQYSKELVEDLIRRKDLAVGEENVHVWDVGFEEDNFSVNELIDAAKQLAIRKGVTIKHLRSLKKDERKNEISGSVMLLSLYVRSRRSFCPKQIWVKNWALWLRRESKLGNLEPQRLKLRFQKLLSNYNRKSERALGCR